MSNSEDYLVTDDVVQSLLDLEISHQQRFVKILAPAIAITPKLYKTLPLQTAKYFDCR